MADEKENRYEEEGEYHFSDDQVNYDAEPEMPKSASHAGLTKESIIAKFRQYRRGIAGIISVVIVILIVYKMLSPSSEPPQTDFSQANPSAVAKTKPVAPKVTKPAVKPAMIQQPAVVPAQTPAQPPEQQVQQAPAAQIPAQPSLAAQPIAPAPYVQQSPAPATTQAAPAASEIKNILDRLAVLEQQNAVMMNLLQTEYAQKIENYETQENAVRGKMEEITKRVNRMEPSLNQMTELLKSISKSSMPDKTESTSAMPETKSAEPKTIYVVQAIIPGRAWLKSESGDTVTVAEGDYLKNYGRITKIDPYDGIVAIDTGKNIITLSYGMGSD